MSNHKVSTKQFLDLALPPTELQNYIDQQRGLEITAFWVMDEQPTRVSDDKISFRCMRLSNHHIRLWASSGTFGNADIQVLLQDPNNNDQHTLKTQEVVAPSFVAGFLFPKPCQATNEDDIDKLFCCRDDTRFLMFRGNGF